MGSKSSRKELRDYIEEVEEEDIEVLKEVEQTRIASTADEGLRKDLKIDLEYLSGVRDVLIARNSVIADLLRTIRELPAAEYFSVGKATIEELKEVRKSIQQLLSIVLKVIVGDQKVLACTTLKEIGADQRLLSLMHTEDDRFNIAKSDILLRMNEVSTRYSEVYIKVKEAIGKSESPIDEYLEDPCELLL